MWASSTYAAKFEKVIGGGKNIKDTQKLIPLKIPRATG
jgi:hypothetical protein